MNILLVVKTLSQITVSAFFSVDHFFSHCPELSATHHWLKVWIFGVGTVVLPSVALIYNMTSGASSTAYLCDIM